MAPNKKGKIENQYDRMMAAQRKILNAYRRWCDAKQPALNDDNVDGMYRNESKEFIFIHKSGQQVRVPQQELEEA